MAFPQTGADHNVGIIAEVTNGTTPATPEFKLLPYSGVTVKDAVEPIESARLGVPVRFGTRHGNISVEGDITAELVLGEFDDLLASAVGGAWSTNTLKSGVLRSSYSLIRRYGAIGVELFRGCEVTSFGLAIGQNANVELTFGFIGTDKAPGNTAPASTTYTAVTDELPLAGFDVTIKKGGVVVGIATDFNLTVDRQIEASYVIGKKTTGAKPKGKMNIDGDITIQLLDFTWQQLFEDEERTDLEFTFTDPFRPGMTLAMALPNVLINSADDDVSADGEIPLSLSFYAEYDAVSESGITFTRTPASGS